MLNLFFMLRLFFHFFSTEGILVAKKKNCDGRVGAVERVRWFYSFFHSLLLRCQAFCVQKLLFSSDLFSRKKYTENFFITSTSTPPSRNHSREFLYSFVPCYPLPFLFSSLFFSVKMKKSIFSFFLAFYI
jgi:hypothetical protein